MHISESADPIVKRVNRLSFLFLLVAFLFLILAVSDLSVKLPARGKTVVCLADISSSIPYSCLCNTEKQIEKYRKEAAKTESTFELVPFAARPFPPSADLSHFTIPSSEQSETNIAAALETAADLLAYKPNPAIFLFSDGNPTTGDTLQTARRIGIPIFVFPVSESREPDVSIDRMETPSSIHREEPFELKIEIQSRTETDAELILFRNGTESEKQVLHLFPGKTEITIPQKLDLSAEWKAVLYSDSDTHPENNRGTVSTNVNNPPAYLLVSANPEEISAFAEQFRRYTGKLDILPPEKFDSKDISSYSAVLLSNLAADDLSDTQLEDLDHYVRDDGNALFLFGGPRTFAAGKYSGTFLEGLLPVNSDFGPDREKSVNALLPVVDTSGSMKGEKLRRVQEGILAAADQLRGSDLFGLIRFDETAEILLPLEHLSITQEFRSKIASMQAGGGTKIEPALQDAVRILKNTEADRKHILLLTDGISPPFNPKPLIADMQNEKISISAITLGESVSEELPRFLAQKTGGIFYRSPAVSAIPRIFIEETKRIERNAVEESEITPSLLLPDRIPDLLPSPLPPIHGFLRTEAKPESEVILAASDGHPLLAQWRLGLGSVTVWTSDITPRWTSNWLALPEYGAFWSFLIRNMEKGPPITPESVFTAAAEWRIPPPETELLTRLAEISGGKLNPAPTDAFALSSGEESYSYSLQNFWTFLAIVSIVLSIWVKRTARSQLSLDKS